MDEQGTGLNTESNAPEQTPTFSPEQQTLMNKVVAREKAKAAEAARREAEANYQQQQSEAQNAQRNQAQQQANVPREAGNDALIQQFDDLFNQKVQAHQKMMQEQQLREQMHKVANDYLSNVSQGKSAYEDYDEITKDFDPTEFPQVTYLLSGNPNAADVLYELSNNPEKFALINNLAKDSPRMAQNLLAKLTKSIVDNKQAKSESQSQNVSQPLDRLTPSRVAGSNGKMGIRDLRNQPWLRG